MQIIKELNARLKTTRYMTDTLVSSMSVQLPSTVSGRVARALATADAVLSLLLHAPKTTEITNAYWDFEAARNELIAVADLAASLDTFRSQRASFGSKELTQEESRQFHELVGHVRDRTLRVDELMNKYSN